MSAIVVGTSISKSKMVLVAGGGGGGGHYSSTPSSLLGFDGGFGGGETAEQVRGRLGW